MTRPNTLIIKKITTKNKGIYSSNKIIYEKTMSNIVLNNEGQYILPSHIIEMTRTFAFVTPIQKL